MTALPTPTRPHKSCFRGLLPWIAAAALTCAWSGSAWAVDFRLCNSTASRVGVAVGYKDGKAWVTEGWWNIPASSCETLLKGTLVARYYYIYAVDYDHGGDWGGSSYMCTEPKEFTIHGIENCLARGYSRTGFFEIDTGEQRSWTVQLTDPSANAESAPPKNASASNDTPVPLPVPAKARTGRSAAH